MESQNVNTSTFDIFLHFLVAGSNVENLELTRHSGDGIINFSTNK
jgi:hypothetical protein